MTRAWILAVAGLVGLAVACSGGTGDDPHPSLLLPRGTGALVRFLGPERVSTSAQFHTVSGLLLGDLTGVSVRQDDAPLAEVPTGPYFELAPSLLQIGLNHFQVAGQTADGRSLSHSMTVIYNPEGEVPEGRVRPDFVESGVKVSLMFSVDTAGVPLLPDGVEVWSASTDGRPDQFLIKMLDDGDLGGHGDDVAGDKVYSARLDRAQGFPAGTWSYYVALAAKRNGENVWRFSPRLDVEVVDPVSEADCATHRQRLGEVRARFDLLHAEQGFDAAREALLGELALDPGLAQAGSGADADAIWLRFADGLLGVVPLNQFLPAEAPLARTALGDAWWSPSGAAILGDHNALLAGDAPALAEAIQRQECPALLPATASTGGTALPHAWVARLGTGLVLVQGGGALAFGGLEAGARAALDLPPGEEAPLVVLQHDDVCHGLDETGDVCSYDPIQPLRSEHCKYGKECVIQEEREDLVQWGVCLDRRQLDLRAGRLVLAPDGYALSPGFFRRYLPRVPGGVALLDVPFANHNGLLAAEFLAKGFTLVATRAERKGEAPLAALAGDLLGSQAWGAADHPGLTLFGSTRVGFGKYDLANGDFSAGGLGSWAREGDARQVDAFDGENAPDGHGMALLSTGLGLTAERGALEQVFCPPPGAKTLSFWWRFYSSEFKESCGLNQDVGQDEFRATFTVGAESDDILDATVNRLCAVDDGQCAAVGICPRPGDASCTCGQLQGADGSSDLTERPGLTFDSGDVWATAWRQASFNVSGVAGRPVRLRFEVRDRGDSLLDSAVLIDKIETR